jgi:hypothetical protein
MRKDIIFEVTEHKPLMHVNKINAVHHGWHIAPQLTAITFIYNDSILSSFLILRRLQNDKNKDENTPSQTGRSLSASRKGSFQRHTGQGIERKFLHFEHCEKLI